VLVQARRVIRGRAGGDHARRWVGPAVACVRGAGCTPWPPTLLWVNPESAADLICEFPAEGRTPRAASLLDPPPAGRAALRPNAPPGGSFTSKSEKIPTGRGRARPSTAGSLTGSFRARPRVRPDDLGGVRWCAAPKISHGRHLARARRERRRQRNPGAVELQLSRARTPHRVSANRRKAARRTSTLGHQGPDWYPSFREREAGAAWRPARPELVEAVNPRRETVRRTPYSPGW